ncbi:hypothetical protein BGZ61DRAFT_521445, partial [Ilyonectria robusta]|uniref:uncharacterized protein n=1 Tax=Ilyonectria robusta TaxID=1079257 RepID=UPI001E8D72BD
KHPFLDLTFRTSTAVLFFSVHISTCPPPAHTNKCLTRHIRPRGYVKHAIRGKQTDTQANQRPTIKRPAVSLRAAGAH